MTELKSRLLNFLFYSAVPIAVLLVFTQFLFISIDNNASIFRSVKNKRPYSNLLLHWGMGVAGSAPLTPRPIQDASIFSSVLHFTFLFCDIFRSFQELNWFVSDECVSSNTHPKTHYSRLIHTIHNFLDMFTNRVGRKRLIFTVLSCLLCFPKL